MQEALSVNAKHCGHIRANSGECERAGQEQEEEGGGAGGGGCGDIPGTFETD